MNTTRRPQTTTARQQSGTTWMRRLAGAVGLAALVSTGALAATSDSTNAQTLDGHAAEVSTDRAHDHVATGQAHAAAMSLVEPANATHTAVASGGWSFPATWGGDVPGTASMVHIPAGITVTVDATLDPEIERIGVDGTLRFATDVNTELKVDTLVTSPSGTFEMGTPDDPIADDVIASVQFADDGPIDRAQDPGLISRGALLHGKTVVQGSNVTHRTTVTSYPRSGDTSVDVNGPLVGWDAGDEIVITGTQGPTSDERRIVTVVDGTTVRFAEPLRNDHVPPADDLDLYVANLTRNVRFSSENSEIERRGHLMVMHTLDAQIRGARFSNMGRTDKSRELGDVDFGEIEPGAVGWDGSFQKLDGRNVRGRYTVHVHRGGANPLHAPAVIADSVVTGDPGWAFTNHSSHVDFLRNVAYDNAGAGFFTEAGDETGRWIDNIAIRTVMANFVLDDAGAIDPDLRADRQDFGVDGDGFWLQGNRVDLIGNVSAGASAHGIIWWSESLAEADLGQVARVDVATLPDPSLVPDRDQLEVWWAPLGEVRDNVAYGSVVGVRARYIHGATYLGDPNVPPAAYIESLRPTIDGIVTWNVRDGVLMNYNERLHLKNIRAIGIAEPFRHNYGATAAVGVGLDVNNDATFGPGSIENVDLQNFEVGLLAPRHGRWTVNNLTTSSTTDVLIHNPVHTERSLAMTNVTFAPLDGTDLAGRESSRRNIVLAYEANGDGDGVDPSTAEDGASGEAQRPDRVTWDGLGLYSPSSVDLPATAQSHPQLTNGLVGPAADEPTMTHVPGIGAMSDENDEDAESGDDELDEGDGHDDDELDEEGEDPQDDEELVEDGELDHELDEDDDLVEDDDRHDAIDWIVDKLIESLDDDPLAMDALLERCEYGDDAASIWSLVCPILRAEGHDEDSDHDDHSDHDDDDDRDDDNDDE